MCAHAHTRTRTNAGRWEVCVSACQALAKVAVRSPEPYRIQAYTTLATAMQVGSSSA